MGKIGWCAIALCLMVPASGFADLQNVQVGGKIEIYGAWYSPLWESEDAMPRMSDSLLTMRPIGPDGTLSFVRTDGKANSYAFFEQRTRLHVNADLTDNVSAFIEFMSIGTWGDNFRSNYLTGVDRRGDSDVALFQSYIEAAEMFGQPLRLRVGRQGIEFGSGWLVGIDQEPDPFISLSFDAVRLTYAAEPFTVDAWWSKLAERSPLEEDGDVDFYGIYATYKNGGGQDDAKAEDADAFEIDLYWMFVRDASAQRDTAYDSASEWFEHRLGLDDYSVTNLHTVGSRFAGKRGAIDWECEAAYQWGEADALGALFIPVGGLYGDDKARWDTWAGHAQIGYAFDWTLKPRFYAGGAYYGGEDNRDVSFSEWINPFHRAHASASFNRLFSTTLEDLFLDISALSNFWKVYAGVTVTPVEPVEVEIVLTYLEAVEGFDYPWSVDFGKYKIPVLPFFPFVTEEGAKDLGWQLGVFTTYQYSADLSFQLWYGHWFVGDGVADGMLFVDNRGLTNVGGNGHHDADYLGFVTAIEF